MASVHLGRGRIYIGDSPNPVAEVSSFVAEVSSFEIQEEIEMVSSHRTISPIGAIAALALGSSMLPLVVAAEQANNEEPEPPARKLRTKAIHNDSVMEVNTRQVRRARERVGRHKWRYPGWRADRKNRHSPY